MNRSDLVNLLSSASSRETLETKANERQSNLQLQNFVPPCAFGVSLTDAFCGTPNFGSQFDGVSILGQSVSSVYKRFSTPVGPSLDRIITNDKLGPSDIDRTHQPLFNVMNHNNVI